MSGLQRPIPLLESWAVRTSSLNLPINAEHEAGQVASTVFQVCEMNRPGIDPSLSALKARAQHTVNVAQCRFR